MGAVEVGKDDQAAAHLSGHDMHVPPVIGQLAAFGRKFCHAVFVRDAVLDIDEAALIGDFRPRPFLRIIGERADVSPRDGFVIRVEEMQRQRLDRLGLLRRLRIRRQGGNDGKHQRRTNDPQ